MENNSKFCSFNRRHATRWSALAILRLYHRSSLSLGVNLITASSYEIISPMFLSTPTIISMKFTETVLWPERAAYFKDDIYLEPQLSPSVMAQYTLSLLRLRPQSLLANASEPNILVAYFDKSDIDLTKAVKGHTAVFSASTMDPMGAMACWFPFICWRLKWTDWSQSNVYERDKESRLRLSGFKASSL